MAVNTVCAIRSHLELIYVYVSRQFLCCCVCLSVLASLEAVVVFRIYKCLILGL